MDWFDLLKTLLIMTLGALISVASVRAVELQRDKHKTKKSLKIFHSELKIIEQGLVEVINSTKSMWAAIEFNDSGGVISSPSFYDFDFNVLKEQLSTCADEVSFNQRNLLGKLIAGIDEIKVDYETIKDIDDGYDELTSPSKKLDAFNEFEVRLIGLLQSAAIQRVLVECLINDKRLENSDLLEESSQYMALNESNEV